MIFVEPVIGVFFRLICGPVFFFLNPEIPRTVNFVIFAGVLIYILRKPLSRFLLERVEGIRRDLTEAREKKEDIEARLRDVESRMGRLATEIEEMRASAAREVLAEQARIRATSDAELDKLRAMTRREIEGAKSAALLELKAYAATQAVELAERLIRAELREDDQHHLVTRFTDRLEEMRP